MTGIAIVLYLNQPPYQVRERDYAYAGSFYMFAIWIGLGVAALYQWLGAAAKKVPAPAIAGGVSALCLLVPVLMAAQNWDDHDRSNRYTAPEMAWNYLNSVGENGLLVTHGDNDTFPLWYAQEIEGVRTDVRVVNTSLLGTDWYIDQMKWACNESKPLKLTVPQEQYLYGTNEFVYIAYDDGSPMLLSDVMDVFKDPKMKVPLESGRKLDFICARNIVIPVNKENCLKYGIVPEKFADEIPEQIMLTMSKDKNYISKPELFLLDVRRLLLSLYAHPQQSEFYGRRQGGCPATVPGLQDQVQVGCVKAHGLLCGLPEHVHLPGRAQNMYTFLGVLSQRQLFLTVANALIDAGEDEKALEIMDLCQENFPEQNYPLESIPLGFSGNDYMVAQMVENYYYLGEVEKARDLAARFGDQLTDTARFYLEWGSLGSHEFETASRVLLYVSDVCKQYGDKDLSEAIVANLEALLHAASGGSYKPEHSSDSLEVEG